MIVACLAALGFLVIKVLPDRWAEFTKRVPAIAQLPGQQKEPPVRKKTPEEMAIDLDLRVVALRQELIRELRAFQQTYDYRTGGWGGGAGTSKNLIILSAEPEESNWIAMTTNPKLRRARDLQRDIFKTKEDSAKAHAKLRK